MTPQKSKARLFSVVLNGKFASTKISAERLFSSADSCYNDMGDENG